MGHNGRPTTHKNRAGGQERESFFRKALAVLPSSLLIVPCSEPSDILPSSVQRERVQRIVHRDEHVLTAVDREGLRRVRGAADARVPERLAGLGVRATKLPPASPPKSRPPAVVSRPPDPPPPLTARIRIAPRDLAGLGIDRRQEAAAPSRRLATALPPRPIEPRGSGSVR